MITALLRFTPAYGIDTLDDPSPRGLVVQRGALVPLSISQPTAVVVDHNEDQQVGVVKWIAIWPYVLGGIVRDWYHASVELDDPPAWLKVGGGVSWAYNPLQVQDVAGTTRRLLRGVIREISLLSPAETPKEPFARVLLLERHSSPAVEAASDLAAGEIIYGDGRAIRRSFETEITIR